jgi:PAS domain S-box-containing protein
MASELHKGFDTLFGIAPIGIIALAPDGRIALVNPALASMFGYTPDELAGQPLELLVPDALRASHVAHRADFMTAPRMRPMGIGLEVLGRRKDGQMFPIEAGLGYLQRAGQPIPVAFVADITERKQIQDEHERRLQQERTVIERAHRRQLFLAEASRSLAASLDYETTLANLAQSAIPFLGDCCMVDLLIDDQIQRVALAHGAPEKAAIMQELRQRYPLALDTTSWVARVLHSGQPILQAEIPQALLIDEAKDAPQLQLLRRIGITSALLVPICLRERMLGVLSIFISESDRRYNSDDLALAQELALLAAQAINNAQLVRSAQAATRRTEEALALLDTLVQSAPIGLTFLDCQLRYRLINPYLATINGVPPAAHIGHTLGEIVPTIAPYLEPLFQQVLDTGEPLLDVDFPGQLPADPQQFRHWQCNFYPVRTPSGEMLGVGVVVFDITARKQAEAALTRYQLLAEHSSDIFLFVKRDGRVIEANHAAITAYGYDRATLLTKTLADLRDPATVGDLPGMLQRVYETDIQFETRHRHRDGTTFPVEINARSAMIDDEHIILGIVRDISERQQTEVALRASEERFRVLFARSPDAILLIDPHHPTCLCPIMECNDAACSMHGYTRAELIGNSLGMLNAQPPTAQQLAAYIEDIRRMGVVKLNQLHHRKDGSIFPIEIMASLISLAGRELLLAIERDISERTQAELALQQQTMLLQLLQGVASAANQATAPEDVLHVAIKQICDCIDWPVGHVYLAPTDGSCPLVSTNIWHLREPERFAVFRSITEAITTIALDDLPGRVLLSGQPEWIADLTSVPNAVRTKLISDIGVHAGFAFPILVGAEVAAVLEFFATEPQEPDAALLDVMGHIGAQLAHLIERTRVVAALRTAEEKYRLLVEQIPAIIYIADSDSRSSTRYISPQIETILGFTPAEWLADPELWLKQIHPDDRARVLAELAQAYTSAGPVPTEYRSHNRDGRIVWLRDESQVVRGEDGRPLFLQGITSDITERHQTDAALRQSEQLYRTLARNFPSGAVFLFDHDLRYTIADGKSLAEQGYMRENIEGRTMYEVLSPEALNRQEPLYRAALAGHESVRETMAGEYTFLTYYLPVRNERGEIFAGMVVSHDITALKQAEQALVAERVLLARRVAERTADLSTANAELARAARLKDEFLASMSHELRTPLNAVLGLTESLREQTYGPLSDRQERPLQMIEDSSRHLLSLINDILDLAKIGAGQLSLDMERVAVESICQASLRMIRQAAEKKQLDIQLLLDPTATHVRADARRLIQILVNLLTNAVKFTPAGGTIGLEVQSDTERQVLRFTVWDTGIGIPTDQLARLFQPFVQLDSRLARQYEGTGLGLALVARMTEMHGGSVAVSSAVGAGSRFSIVLPWNAARAEPAPLAPLATTAVIRRALIIEDSPTAANQAVRYLAELGIMTETLTAGSDAISQAHTFQPDVILLDILLPDTSGWLVLAQLKADPATQAIPVVITSVVDDQSRGRALGAAKYLVKPCTRRDLQDALKCLSGEHTPALAEPSSAPDANQPTILLAEDNEASILIVTDYLAMLGYEVAVARNGVEAITVARELQPALILMDIQMPGMDGLEATRLIRADAELAAVPIIAITALAMPGDHAMCLAAGANDYISKPISLKNLAALIAEHLQRTQPGDRQPIPEA